MSRARLILHGRVGPPPPPPPPPPSSAFALGLVLAPAAYYMNMEPTGDLVRIAGDSFKYDGDVAVPAANRDSNGTPSSMPGGSTYIRLFIQTPSALTQRTISWTNVGTGPTSITVSGNATVNSSTATSITFTPTISHPSNGAIFVQYVVTSGNYPKDFTCSTGAGTLGTNFSNKISGIGGSGPVRFIQWTSVERNTATDFFNSGHVGAYDTIKFPQNGDGQINETLYTSTNRNLNLNDPGYLDGVRIETMISIATALNRDAWINMPWNVDGTNSSGVFTSSTYYNNAAALWAAFAVATGKNVILELSNECWNTGTYMVAHQCRNEATYLGITTEQRYAQKSAQMFAAFESAFASAGVSSKLKWVLCWQNAGSTTAWDNMASQLGSTTFAKVSALATAPYMGDNGVTGDSTARTGSVDPVIALSYTNIGVVVDTYLAGHKTKATSLGKPLWVYECGTHYLYTDTTLRQNLQTDGQLYDLMREYFSRLTTVLGASAVGCYYTLTFPIYAGGNGTFGLLTYISQPGDLANAPKYKALVDYLS